MINQSLPPLLWNQFGAAIDMLENAIKMCPPDIWKDRSAKPEFWYNAFHTVFWLDFYLADPVDEFTPPEPFTLSELDPAGVLPDRVYSPDELLQYLEHGHNKARETIKNLTNEKATKPFVYGSIDMPFGELLFYNLRHVQHHTAQLNLVLRQKTDSAPGWIKQTGIPLD